MLSDWLCENSHASFSTHHKENQNQLLVLSKLQVTAGNSDWLIKLFAPVVIARGNNISIGFSALVWKPLYKHSHAWGPFLETPDNLSGPKSNS